jgi:hypothetical protein
MGFSLTPAFKPVNRTLRMREAVSNGFSPVTGASSGLKAGVNVTVFIRGDSRDSRANKHKYQGSCDLLRNDADKN